MPLKRRGRILRRVPLLVEFAIGVGLLALISVPVWLLTWPKTMPAEALRPVSKGDLVALATIAILAIAVLIFVRRRR